MSAYNLVEGQGDTITCDNCSELASSWYTDGSHAVCQECGEFYLLTEQGENRTCGDHLTPIRECGCKI
jgi:hypothetical protein